MQVAAARRLQYGQSSVRRRARDFPNAEPGATTSPCTCQNDTRKPVADATQEVPVAGRDGHETRPTPFTTGQREIPLYSAVSAELWIRIRTKGGWYSHSFEEERRRLVQGHPTADRQNWPLPRLLRPELPAGMTKAYALEVWDTLLVILWYVKMCGPNNGIACYSFPLFGKDLPPISSQHD